MTKKTVIPATLATIITAASAAHAQDKADEFFPEYNDKVRQEAPKEQPKQEEPKIELPKSIADDASPFLKIYGKGEVIGGSKFNGHREFAKLVFAPFDDLDNFRLNVLYNHSDLTTDDDNEQRTIVDRLAVGPAFYIKDFYLGADFLAERFKYRETARGEATRFGVMGKVGYANEKLGTRVLFAGGHGSGEFDLKFPGIGLEFEEEDMRRSFGVLKLKQALLKGDLFSDQDDQFDDDSALKGGQEGVYLLLGAGADWQKFDKVVKGRVLGGEAGFEWRTRAFDRPAYIQGLATFRNEDYTYPSGNDSNENYWGWKVKQALTSPKHYA